MNLIGHFAFAIVFGIFAVIMVITKSWGAFNFALVLEAINAVATIYRFFGGS